MHHPTERIAHTTAFVTPVVEHWLERENMFTKPSGMKFIPVLINTHFTVVLHQNKEKEGNILFNGTLNTFYSLLYGVGHIVNDHSDSKREETYCSHYMGYSF